MIRDRKPSAEAERHILAVRLVVAVLLLLCLLGGRSLNIHVTAREWRLDKIWQLPDHAEPTLTAMT